MQSVKSVVKTMTIALLSSLLIVNISYAADQQRRYEADAAKKQQTIQIFKSAYERTKSENAALTLALEQNIAENAVATAVESIVTEKQYVDTPEEENATERVSYSKERLPEGVATNRYDCEGYIFPAGTHQAMLQAKCITSPTTGARVFRDDKMWYYCVAMGGAYGIDIGDAWSVTLRNGSVFNVTLADYQHDITEPDPNDFGERYEYDKDGNIVGPLRNYDGEECVHVLEFIADLETLPQAAKEAGGMHGLEFFGGKFGDGGNIVKMEYLGRKWVP